MVQLGQWLEPGDTLRGSSLPEAPSDGQGPPAEGNVPVVHLPDADPVTVDEEEAVMF